MDHHYFEAILANSVYSMPYNTNECSTSRIRLENYFYKAKQDYPAYKNHLNNLEIVKTNMDYAVILNKELNTFYVVARGSNMHPNQTTMMRDVINDLQISVGMIPHRTQQIFMSVKQLEHNFPQSKIIVIGHSLGGTIAEYIGKLDHSVKVVTFNAGETVFSHLPTSEDLNYLLQKSELIHYHSNITNVNAKGDIVSNNGLFSNNNNVIFDFHVDRIKAHYLDNFLPEKISVNTSTFVNDLLSEYTNQNMCVHDNVSNAIHQELSDSSLIHHESSQLVQEFIDSNSIQSQSAEPNYNIDQKYETIKLNKSDIIFEFNNKLQIINSKLEMINLIKHWSHMNKSEKIHFLVGAGIKYCSHDVKLQLLSNLIMQKQLSIKDISWLGLELYTGLPMNNVSKFMYHLSHG